MKKILKIAVIVLLILFAAVFGAYKFFEYNLKDLANIEISDFDISKIKDGDYPGSFSASPVSAEVLVSVRGQKITEIRILKHSNGQGAAAEALPAKIVEAQTLKVETVSGATYSSKVILKAVENALTNFMKK